MIRNMFTKKRIWMAILCVCVMFGGKLAYKAYLMTHRATCMENSPDISYSIYDEKTPGTIDITLPLSYIWPGNNFAWQSKRDVLGVTFDYETLRPYCLRYDEWRQEELQRRVKYSGWDPRYMRLSITKSIKPVPQRGRWQKDDFILPDGKDEYGYETYIEKLDPTYKHKYGYRRLHIIPAGILSEHEEYVSCNIVATSRDDVPEWRGKPNICRFYMQYRGTNLDVDFQYEKMANLPGVKRKAQEFMDTYSVDSVGGKIWHFLTS